MSFGRGGGGHRATSGPWGRLRSVQLDPLEAVGLPSKGDTQLLTFKAQDQYYNLIVTRYMTFCASSGSGSALDKHFASLSLSSSLRDVSPAPTSISKVPLPSPITRPPARSASTPIAPTDVVSAKSPNDELQLLLSSLRKLREALLSTQRPPPFATTVYTFSIRLSLLLSHHQSYHPSLLHLLNQLHAISPLPPPILQEFASYVVLDLACRQRDLAGAFEMRHRYNIRGYWINEVLKAVVHDDFVRFWRARRGVDGYQGKIVDYSANAMRAAALKTLGRAYIGCGKGWVEECSGGLGWDDLKETYGVGWALEAGNKVIIRKGKIKAPIQASSDPEVQGGKADTSLTKPRDVVAT